MSEVKPRRARAFLINASVLLVVTLGVLLAAEPLLRLRYVEPVPSQPPAVAEVQPYLTLHPDLGYTWIPNVSTDRNIVFHNNDIEYDALCTDEFGVVNTPDAIALRAAGEPVRVLGLGDSFMEMAAQGFHRAFGERETFYYSLAIHRHAPPHYAAMFRLHGSALKPSVVLVGLFENDFAETEDFENWRKSGLDWFAYHSGTWCGRPVPISAERRFIRRWFRGYEGLTNVLRIRLRGERMSVAGPSDDQVARVMTYLSELAEAARADGAVVWLILIPSKPTARGEVTPEAKAYDRVAEALAPKAGGIIDLRPVFQQHPDPESLYYRIDGHWNRAGVALAAETVLARLSSATTASDSHEPRGH